MEETKNNEIKTEVKKAKNTKYQTKCFKCKDKDKLTLDNGTTIPLNYKLVEVSKDKELIKECKNLVKEGQEKYKKDYVMKRSLINGCPYCKNTINIDCKEYVDFYTPKKKEEKNEK